MTYQLRIELIGERGMNEFAMVFDVHDRHSADDLIRQAMQLALPRVLKVARIQPDVTAATADRMGDSVRVPASVYRTESSIIVPNGRLADELVLDAARKWAASGSPSATPTPRVYASQPPAVTAVDSSVAWQAAHMQHAAIEDDDGALD